MVLKLEWKFKSWRLEDFVVSLFFVYLFYRIFLQFTISSIIIIIIITCTYKKFNRKN